MLSKKDTKALSDLIQANGIIDILDAIRLYALGQKIRKSHKQNPWGQIHDAVESARKTTVDAVEDSWHK